MLRWRCTGQCWMAPTAAARACRQTNSCWCVSVLLRAWCGGRNLFRMTAAVASRHSKLLRAQHDSCCCKPAVQVTQAQLPAAHLQALVALLRYVLTTMTQPMVAWLVEPACSQAVRDAVS